MTTLPINPMARLLDLRFRLRIAHELAQACSRTLPPEWPATQGVITRVERLLADCAEAVARECREEGT